MHPFSFYVLHYGSQHLSGLDKKETVPIKKVFILIFPDVPCCHLFQVYV